jgi:hypothetical protein
MQKLDQIRINQSRFTKSLELTVTIFSFVDKDTMQHIRYVPSLDLSSYGNDADKAQLMLDTSLQEELNRILAMNNKQAKSYLAQYGWKIQPHHNKNLSNVVVDKHGALQDFNVDIDSVVEEKVNRKEILELA